jgi:uncharacterized protein
MTLDEVLQRVAGTAYFLDAVPAHPNQRGLFDNYPLHIVAGWGDCEGIRLLLAAGACIDQRGEHGFKPLMEAVLHGHQDAALLLIELGASPLRNDDGQSPSEYASIAGEEALASVLAERGY